MTHITVNNNITQQNNRNQRQNKHLESAVCVYGAISKGSNELDPLTHFPIFDQIGIVILLKNSVPVKMKN